VNFRTTPNQDIDIVVTPLIDVILVLLIFYMVTTTFVTESRMELSLPQASAEASSELPPHVEVVVDRDGNVYVDGHALLNTQVTTIKRALTQARAGHVEPLVVISADANARHQAVVDVMDAARQLGLFKITFPTRLRDE